MQTKKRKKSVVRAVFEYDVERNRYLEKAIKEKQRDGSYPDHFKFPIALQFELTSKCNLRCKHCYNFSGENSKPDRMSPEDWLDLTRQIVKAGGLFECVISGGEPLLLGDKLIPIMDTLHDDKCSFVFITNGFLLNKEWVKKLKKYTYSFFQVSIDGHNAELHDNFRGVKGSFERAVQGVFDMANEGVHVRIAHSVSKTTKDGIDKVVDLAYKIGASSIILGESSSSGRAFLHKDETILSKKERDQLYKDIGKISEKYKGRMQIFRGSFTKTQLVYYRINPNSVAIIRPDGSVRLDCMAPFIIGNVKDEPFAEIWRKKSAKCWHDKKVKKYVDSIRGDRGDSCLIKNYVDADVLI